MAPPGWTGSLHVLAGDTFWNYDPLQDPKFLAGDYGPNPNPWINPSLIVWSVDNEVNAIQVGGVAADFGFLSPFLPINAPAQFQAIDGQIFSVDPPTPGDVLFVPEPATITLAAISLIALLLRRRRRHQGSSTAPRLLLTAHLSKRVLILSHEDSMSTVAYSTPYT